MSLEAEIDIPTKPKAHIPEVPTNGAVEQENGTTGKRKRTADDAELENGGPQTKKFAKIDTDGDGDHPIVLDDDSGAILIDD